MYLDATHNAKKFAPWKCFSGAERKGKGTQNSLILST